MNFSALLYKNIHSNQSFVSDYLSPCRSSVQHQVRHWSKPSAPPTPTLLPLTLTGTVLASDSDALYI